MPKRGYHHDNLRQGLQRLRVLSRGRLIMNKQRIKQRFACLDRVPHLAVETGQITNADR